MNNEDLDKHWLERTVADKVEECALLELTDITYDHLITDGCTSDIQQIKLRYGGSVGNRRMISLIRKLPRKDSLDHKHETQVYTTALKYMERLMVEKGDKRERLWPIFYGHLPYHLILLENLRDDGFRTLKRSQLLDLGYALLTLRELGRLHAMSKMLELRNLIGDEFRGVYPPGKMNPFGRKFYEGSLHILTKCMIDKKGPWNDVSSSEKFGTLLRNKIPTWFEEVDDVYCNYDKKFDILNHGDPKSSNILFRSMDCTNTPPTVKFVDYQMSHINSFMWDLTFFIANSTQPQIRRNHSDRLLLEYWQSLLDNLKYFGWNDYCPTLNDVQNEYRRLAIFRFLLVSTTMPVFSATDEDVVRFDKVLTHPPEESFSESPFLQETFVKEYVEDLKQFEELQLI